MRRRFMSRIWPCTSRKTGDVVHVAHYGYKCRSVSHIASRKAKGPDFRPKVMTEYLDFAYLVLPEQMALWTTLHLDNRVNYPRSLECIR